MSLPNSADVSVNCVPANCIPSPLSPAKRIVTLGRVVSGFPFPFLRLSVPATPIADSVVRLMFLQRCFRAPPAPTLMAGLFRPIQTIPRPADNRCFCQHFAVGRIDANGNRGQQYYVYRDRLAIGVIGKKD